MVCWVRLYPHFGHRKRDYGLSMNQTDFLALLSRLFALSLGLSISSLIGDDGYSCSTSSDNNRGRGLSDWVEAEWVKGHACHCHKHIYLLQSSAYFSSSTVRSCPPICPPITTTIVYPSKCVSLLCHWSRRRRRLSYHLLYNLQHPLVSFLTIEVHLAPKLNQHE